MWGVRHLQETGRKIVVGKRENKRPYREAPA